MAVSVWREAAQVGCTKGPKLTAGCCFLLLRCSGKPLLDAFLVTEVFSSGSSQMSFVPDYEGNSVEVVVWPKAARAGRMHGDKVAA